MKYDTVFIPGYPGEWRKTRAHGMYKSGNFDRDGRINAQMYIASCIFLLRYQEERTGMGLNWDAQFARVDNSLKTFTPQLFWRETLSKLDRTAYQILEHVIIEENSIKSLVLPIPNSLIDQDENRGEELRRHREGRRLLAWALREFHTLLTTESFWYIIGQNSIRATPSHRLRTR